MATGPQPGLGLGASTDDILAAYRALSSFAVIAIPSLTTGLLTLPAGGNPYTIVHAAIATESGEVRGTGLIANTDGTLTATRDMFGVRVTCTLVGFLPTTDTIVVGIGIGDPENIPGAPGVQEGENYVSRLRCSRTGTGSTREITWDFSVSPVGKSTTDTDVYGIKAGDKIFPVVWTTENDDAELQIAELIFAVEELVV